MLWRTIVEHTEAGGWPFDDGVYLLLARDTTMDHRIAILLPEDALCVYDDWTTIMKEIKSRRAQKLLKRAVMTKDSWPESVRQAISCGTGHISLLQHVSARDN